MEQQKEATSPTPDVRDEHRSERVGVLHHVIESAREDDVTGLAAEIAYRFLFAVFPFGLFVAALSAFGAGMLHIDNPAGKILSGLGDNLPPSLAASLRPELQRLLSSARPDLLSVGAIGALLAANGGTSALVKGMHRAYDVPEARPFLLRFAISIALTFVAAIGVLASFVTIVGGAAITDWIAKATGLGSEAPKLLDVARWPIVFVGLTLAVGVLYRYAPNVVVPWRWILTGSAAFTLGWLVATAALGLYVDHFTDYGATYGSLAGVIVLMLWFYLSAILLLLGAELTAALAWERSPSEIHRRREEMDAAAKIDGATEGAKDAAKGAANGVAGGGSGEARRPAPGRLSRPGPG